MVTTIMVTTTTVTTMATTTSRGSDRIDGNKA